MNLEVLLGLYQNDIRLKQIAAGISLPGHYLRVYLDNLRGSSINFVATALWSITDINHVFILNDKERGRLLSNTTRNTSQKRWIFGFFPDSFKRIRLL